MKTTEAIRRLLEDDPHRTLEELSGLTGVTRERVRQICVRDGLYRVSPYQGHTKRFQRYCTQCGASIAWEGRSGLCRVCHLSWRRAHSNAITVFLKCTECGIAFERKQHLVNAALKRNPNIRVVCSQRCMGRRAGREFGFSAQTHCQRGHPFDEVNTYHTRACRECMRIRHQNALARRKAQTR